MGPSQSAYRFILLPSFVGLVCCSCASAPKMTRIAEESTDSSSSLSPVASTSVAVPPSPSAATPAPAYREGINLASSAYHLSQTAISPDDWTLIAGRWQQAANQMKQVGAGDENYEVAQQKIAEYARNAAQANAVVANLQASVYAPLVPLPPEAIAPTRPKVAIAVTGAPPSAQRVRVPIVRRLYGTPVVRVTFNGVKTYEMILDTGASRTLITRQMANDLGIVATESMIAATASESAVTFEIGQMRSISLGAITLADARVSIGDSVSIGLLGNDFLSGYDVTIRDRENTVELVEAN